MLIRFIVQNVLSFADSEEFNMLPRPKIRTPEGHKYAVNGIELLKLSAIYGANAAGKSNLISALGLLQELVTGRISTLPIHERRFKFEPKAHEYQMLAAEFVQDGNAYYYGVEIKEGEIITEELYRSGLGKMPDFLLFERKKMDDGKISITFSESFEKDPASQLIKSVLLEDFLEKTKSAIPWLVKRGNQHFREIKSAMMWFSHTLQIITPRIRPTAITMWLASDPSFKSFAQDTLRAYGLGISRIDIREKSFDEVVGGDKDIMLNALKEKLSDQDDAYLVLPSANGNEIVFEKKGDSFLVKHTKITQSDSLGNEAEFDLDELSDGTLRLLDFIPAFRDVTLNRKVYVVDELERSMHPVLAKELVSKFSRDADTKGQLIFTTHESNLLDQSIFRQDEIWFAEKGPKGNTSLYSLSDYKEHNTIDIRKGYLNGRYGAVPFLANLQELNWHAYDTN